MAEPTGLPTDPTTDTLGAPGDGVLTRRRARRRRRRRRRRRLIVLGLVVVLVAGGAGTAWAMRGSGGPGYRTATVRTATVEQTVRADGTLAAHKTATAAFAASGTVASVGVAVGDTVHAGQSLATLDPSSLDTAVTGADTKLAQAQQGLVDDEDAQANGTASTASASSGGSGTATTGGTTTSGGTTTTGGTTGTANFTAFTSERTPAGSGGLSGAQRAVTAAQRRLDQAIAAQDDLVATLVPVCRSGSDTSTLQTAPGNDGTVSGRADGQVIVTLLDAAGTKADTSSQNPQTFTSGGTYSFTGLDAGTTYTVQLVRTGTTDAGRCAQQAAAVGTQQARVDSASHGLDTSLAALTKAIAATAAAGSGSGSGTGAGSSGGGNSGAGRTGSGGTSGSGSTAGTGSGSSRTSGTSSAGGSTSAGTTVTSQQLAADQKAIDAARAELAVAHNDRDNATLTAPISGTVAAVGIAKGGSVSAGSSSSTVTVVGRGTLSVDLSISLADIDLVKAGQRAQVTVDGHTGALPAKVTYVGQTNSSSSTGSSSSYTVTVQLDRTYRSLYDGMGADVSVDVGTVAGAVTVPVSAVHTIGTRHTVQVRSDGKVTTQAVTLGLVGDSLVQVKSGLKAGQQVVLADVGASIPSSETTNRRTGSGLGGLSGRSAGGFGGGAAGGGPGGPP